MLLLRHWHCRVKGSFGLYDAFARHRMQQRIATSNGCSWDPTHFSTFPLTRRDLRTRTDVSNGCPGSQEFAHVAVSKGVLEWLQMCVQRGHMVTKNHIVSMMWEEKIEMLQMTKVPSHVGPFMKNTICKSFEKNWTTFVMVLPSNQQRPE